MAPYLNDNDESWLDVLARNLPDEPAPEVSVVIPTYNHGEYVGQAIESVIQQTWQDFEVIVVDDGSTDHTRSIVEGCDPRVRYIWQENQGLSAARNTGIRLSEGRYIGLLDADDLYEPSFLATLIEFLETHQDISAVYCGYRFVDRRNRPLPQLIFHQTDPEGFFEKISMGNFLVPESILVRRASYLKAGGFDESLTACEDWDMWLRISKSQKVAGIPQPLIRHRILTGSMSSDPARMLNNRLSVLHKHFGPLPEDVRQAPDATREVYSRAYLAAVIEYLQAGDKASAATYLQKMTAIWPQIVLEPATYYELGCGSQPKGYRGDRVSLSLESNALFVFNALDSSRALFAQVNETGSPWSEVMATANYGLGVLGYNTGQFKLARQFLLRAILEHWRFAYDRSLMATFAKSLLGIKLHHRLKKMVSR